MRGGLGPDALGHRLGILGGSLAACAALGTAIPADAKSPSTVPFEAQASGATEAIADVEPDVVTIRVGRAIDFEGKPVYADRSNFSGTAGVTVFSTRPITTLSRRSNSQLSAIAPLANGALSSGFGMRTHPVLGTPRFHAGVDLAAPAGSPIRAASGGVITNAGWQGGYGLLVSIGHGGGEETRYGHLSRIAVAPGQTVRQGDLIGFVGTTGLSTGPHLHYELRVDGRAVRPDMRSAR